MNRRQKTAAQYIRIHGVISAGQLAIRARDTGHPRIAKELLDSLVAERDRRRMAMARVPRDDHKCPHTAGTTPFDWSKATNNLTVPGAEATLV